MTIQKKLQIYFDLIENQFMYGGKKYMTDSSTAEATDILCDKHGYNGLFWVMNKYIIRFRNLKLEKDLLKIGCFCYILWLKRGFHILPTGIDSPILPTPLQIKKYNFSKFKTFIEFSNNHLLSVTSEINDKNILDDSYLDYAEKHIVSWSQNNKWNLVFQEDIDSVFINVFHVWQRNFAGLNTHNEDIGKENEQTN